MTTVLQSIAMRRLCSFSSVPLSIVGLLAITTAASLTPLADAVPSSHLAAAASGAKISAHLTKTSFTSAQASSVKLIYRFSKKSDGFSYLLTFKKSSKWQTVNSVKKKGSFNGSKSVAAKKIFAGKPIKVGSYRLELSSNLARVTLLQDHESSSGVSRSQPGRVAHLCPPLRRQDRVLG